MKKKGETMNTPEPCSKCAYCKFDCMSEGCTLGHKECSKYSNYKKKKWAFQICNGWTIQKGIINVELASVHYESNRLFWIQILFICFHWEKE